MVLEQLNNIMCYEALHRDIGSDEDVGYLSGRDCEYVWMSICGCDLLQKILGFDLLNNAIIGIFFIANSMS